MTAITFIANALTAFGPAAVLFFQFLLHRPSLGLLALAGAFVALVALLITSALWLAIPNHDLVSTNPLSDASRTVPPMLATLVISVLVQELVRAASWKLIALSEGSIILASGDSRSKYIRVHMSGALGYGYALMIGLLVHIQPLISSAGAGMRLSPSCPHIPDVFLGSLTVMLSFFHHVMWTMLMYNALFLGHPVPGSTATASTAATGNNSAARKWGMLGYIVATHMLVSLISVTQMPAVAYNCFIPLAISAVVAGVSGALVWRSVLGSIKKSE
ncbi:Aph-1 protein-domain-containing protein [Blastocladiella britannica]|nr:Aph-1 protein-domain-containing protein [Blastocladiella britannica]